MFIKDDTVRTHIDAPQSLQEATAMGWRVTESKDAAPGAWYLSITAQQEKISCKVELCQRRLGRASFLSLPRSFWNGWAGGLCVRCPCPMSRAKVRCR